MLVTKLFVLGVVTMGTICGCCNEHVRSTLLFEAGLGLTAGVLLASISYLDAWGDPKREGSPYSLRLAAKEILHAFVGGFLVGLLVGFAELLLQA